MYYSIDGVGILGDTQTKFIRASRQDRSEWKNNIFHNSPYGIFKFDGVKLELISSGMNMPKFRKCKCDSLEVAEKKIRDWLNK
jgi:hypothetical protein